MRAKEELAQRGIETVRREYDDRYELAADFGLGTDVSVDVVGGTVIVVHDGESYDIDVDGSARAFIRNGVLTIKVNEEDQA
jgi:hypothetical protein